MRSLTLRLEWLLELEMSSNPREWGKSLSVKWQSLSASKKQSFVEKVRKSADGRLGTLVSNQFRFGAVFKLVEGTPIGRDMGGDSALSDILGEILKVQTRNRGKAPKEQRNLYLRSVLFWLAYYHKNFAEQLFSEFDLDYEPTGDHAELPDRDSEDTPPFYLDLIDPTKREDEEQPHLQMQYWARKTKFYGRNNELESLFQFVKVDAENEFKWWQIAGPAGQGKSRLAVELLKNLPDSENWEAGFVAKLDADFIKKVRNSELRRNTLIIIDYASSPAKEPLLRELITTLDSVAKNKCTNREIIRLLLLDRQPYLTKSQTLHGRQAIDQPGTWQSELAGASEWQLGRMTLHGKRETPPLIPGDLADEDLLRTAKSWLDYRKVKYTDALEKRIYRFLRLSETSRVSAHVDEPSLPTRARRPLVAILAAEAALNDVVVPENSEIDHFEYMLGAVLDEETKQLLRPRNGNGLSAAKVLRQETSQTERDMACFANIVGSYDAYEVSDLPFIDISDESVEQARRLLGYVIPLVHDRNDRPTALIAAREPDLLAEYQFLREFTAPPHRDRLRKLISCAWSSYSTQLSEFLQRLIDDFPNHSVVRNVLEIAPTGVKQIHVWSQLIARLCAKASSVHAHAMFLAFNEFYRSREQPELRWYWAQAARNTIAVCLLSNRIDLSSKVYFLLRAEAMSSNDVRIHIELMRSINIIIAVNRSKNRNLVGYHSLFCDAVTSRVVFHDPELEVEYYRTIANITTVMDEGDIYSLYALYSNWEINTKSEMSYEQALSEIAFLHNLFLKFAPNILTMDTEFGGEFFDTILSRARAISLAFKSPDISRFCLSMNMDLVPLVSERNKLKEIVASSLIVFNSTPPLPEVTLRVLKTIYSAMSPYSGILTNSDINELKAICREIARLREGVAIKELAALCTIRADLCSALITWSNLPDQSVSVPGCTVHVEPRAGFFGDLSRRCVPVLKIDECGKDIQKILQAYSPSISEVEFYPCSWWPGASVVRTLSGTESFSAYVLMGDTMIPLASGADAFMAINQRHAPNLSESNVFEYLRLFGSICYDEGGTVQFLDKLSGVELIDRTLTHEHVSPPKVRLGVHETGEEVWVVEACCVANERLLHSVFGVTQAGAILSMAENEVLGTCKPIDEGLRFPNISVIPAEALEIIVPS